ncbi:hypothetical protein MFIFM68171_05656 [Madurella fahalii]|uniref:Clr5 domain-containing protein n=1 Tax=Madurella fahalii TaxID=1157608 RepID=A0ABQ0GCI1_9PEZI
MNLVQDDFDVETLQNPLAAEDLQPFDGDPIIASGLVAQAAANQGLLAQKDIDNATQSFHSNHRPINKAVVDPGPNAASNIDGTNNRCLTNDLNTTVVLDFRPRHTQRKLSVSRTAPNRAAQHKSKISDKDWEDHKEIIRQLWIVEHHTMPELIRIMTRDYDFSATEKMYYAKFKDPNWAGFAKNKTKQNSGRVASLETPRRRAAQMLPPNSKRDKRDLVFLSAKSKNQADHQDNQVPLPHLDARTQLMDDTSVNTRKMHRALDVFVKGSFGFSAKVKGWSSDSFQLIAPPQVVDNSAAWETLMDQCHCMGLLTQLGLFRCLNSSLQKIFEGFNKLATQPGPVLLIYLWKICSSIFDVRLRTGIIVPGDDPRRGQPFALMRLFLHHMRRSFFLQLGRAHPVVHLMDALAYVLFNSSQEEFKYILGLGYATAIEALGHMIGADHSVVLTMSSHCAKQDWGSRAKLHETIVRARYETLLVEAERIQSRENTVSMLYNYTYTMSQGYGDSEFVFHLASRLRDQAERQCRDQIKVSNLQCGMHVRALVFSTGLLAKNYQWQDSSITCRQLDETIGILEHGDQECLIYALSLSRLLEAKLRARDNADARSEVRRRAEAVRSRIHAVRFCDVAENAPNEESNSGDYLTDIQTRRKREGNEFHTWLAVRVKDSGTM